MSAAFDTLGTARKLRGAGMDQDQAEAITDVVHDSRNGLATKADIKALDNRFDRVDDRFDSLGESLRTEMKALGGRIDTIQWAGALVAGVLTAAVMTTLGIVVMQTFQS